MTEKEFLEKKLYPQNCGDIIKVIKKSNRKDTSQHHYLWECEFINYPYKGYFPKQKIENGSIINPQIEQVEFLDKEWLQESGDILIILKKTDKKEDKKSDYLYKCISKQNNKEYFLHKKQIIEGKALKKEDEFIKNIYKQRCGDSLYILEKTNQKGANTNDYLYKCKFIKYPCEILARKGHILEGTVDNPTLPWKTKEKLSNFISKNFTEKPTLKELTNKLQESVKDLDNFVKIIWVGHQIDKFNLRDKIAYYKEGSYLEEEVKEYLNILKNCKYTNDWDRLNGKEIDIFIEELNLGVEFNGNYWHSELFKKPNYHQEKSLLAQTKNIELFHIWEWEWEEKKEILKALLKSKLRIYDKRIYARKCIIKSLSNTEYQDFCNENHLQGECGAGIKIGLYYENKLVQIMSFGKPRFTDKYEWEIIRECSKLGYYVIGGKEKLWSYFVKHYSPNSVISYCDFSKFSGNSYLKLGFKKLRLNKPGFVWWDKQLNCIFWRNPNHHSEMKNKYLKIYDCGQLVFVWNK